VIVYIRVKKCEFGMFFKRDRSDRSSCKYNFCLLKGSENAVYKAVVW
jgi:hypothetical protein